MTIVYQGKKTETTAANVAEFLASAGVGPSAVVEYNGEILSSRDEAAGAALAEGAELNAFQIVSGG